MCRPSKSYTVGQRVWARRDDDGWQLAEVVGVGPAPLKALDDAVTVRFLDGSVASFATELAPRYARSFISAREAVRLLNQLGTFTFCTFLCDRARVRVGVMQVRHRELIGQEGGWMSVRAWITMSYAPEDHVAALAGAFMHGYGHPKAGNGITEVRLDYTMLT